MDGQRVGAPQGIGKADSVADGIYNCNSEKPLKAFRELFSFNWLSMKAAAASGGGALHLWRVEKVAE
jgi:hypothetical protein